MAFKVPSNLIRYAEQEMMKEETKSELLTKSIEGHPMGSTREEIREAKRKAREKREIVDLAYLPSIGRLAWKDKQGHEGLAPPQALRNISNRIELDGRIVPYELVVEALGKDNSII